MSGIPVSPSLRFQFAHAQSSRSTRFLKVSIKNESLVHDLSVQTQGSSTLIDDLPKLQTILDENTPAYVLARTDEPSGEWLAIYYVPDTAKVRDKMLYASTRMSLTKSLGSAHFPNSLFATSLADLTPSAYTAHLARLAAPVPLSPQEMEMAAIKAAEREAGEGSFEGRLNPLSRVDLEWSDEVEHAVVMLGKGVGGWLVVIRIDPGLETLVLSSADYVTVEKLGSSLPPSEPAYALFAWPHTHTVPPQRSIIFIYSCPTSSPIKQRMLYSSGSSSVYEKIKSILSSADASTLAARKMETSDPMELTEAFLVAELGFRTSAGANGAGGEDGKKGFAKPKVPGKRR